MLHLIVIVTTFFLTSVLHAQTIESLPKPLPDVGFAIIKTSQVAVAQALLVPRGGVTKKVNSNFSAFLIKHYDNYVLFDTGMGKQIDDQYKQGMPIWWRPFFKYDKPVISARDQLDKAGITPVKCVILSHSHWDHAGGILDFPEAIVGVAAAELPLLNNPTTGPGGTWASQIRAASIQWESLVFQPIPFKGYPMSLDLFHDGRVVLVPMPGHTPGSVGLFVKVDSGIEYFFIGDVAWTVAALQQGAPKFWFAARLVDGKTEQTQTSLEKVRSLMKAEPGLVVIPAHDSSVQDKLGYFPAWVK
jgi:glyoxylase-like metal-dependent hydrolase (beta-lactamase superfamily II)